MKKFCKDCVFAYLISLGACVLIAVLCHWLCGFDKLEGYMEGITILLAVEIPMGIAIFRYAGGNIWVRRLLLWLFSSPLVTAFSALLRDKPMTVTAALKLLAGYTIGLLVAYLIADAAERRKLAKINEKLGKNE